MNAKPVKDSHKNIYLISGLGADERAFRNLVFPDCHTFHINWLTPAQNETIHAYTARLTAQIKKPNPVLIGLSFGGLIAIEMSKLIDADKIILISSAKTSDEIPFYFKLTGRLGFYKMIPDRFLNRSNALTEWFFGPNTKEDSHLLKQILKDTDPCFFKWAVSQIINWHNHIVPENAVHIHGSADRIFPMRYIHSDIVIKNGGHLMILNRSEEINHIIRQYI